MSIVLVVDAGSIKIDQVGDKLINDYRLAGDVELRLPQVRNASQAKLDHKRTLINFFVKTVAEHIKNPEWAVDDFTCLAFEK